MTRLPRGTRKFLSVLYLLCKTMGVWDVNIRRAIPPAGIPLYEGVKAACDAFTTYLDTVTFDDPRP